MHALVLLSLLSGSIPAIGVPAEAASNPDTRYASPAPFQDAEPSAAVVRPAVSRPSPRRVDRTAQDKLPTDPQTISTARVWAGTNNAGVWLYAGGAWEQRSNGLGNVQIRSLAVNPANHDTLVAVTPSGLFRTTDAGLNWALVTMPFSQSGWNSVFWDRAPPFTVVASGPDMGEVFNTDPTAAVSSDGGATWGGVDLPLFEPPDTTPQTAEAVPGDVWGFDGVWYIMGNSYNNIVLGWPCHRKTFWRSFDNGLSWHFTCSWLRELWDTWRYVTGLWTDPYHLFGVLDHLVGNPIIESTDAGASWSKGTQYLDTYKDVFADPVRLDRVWVQAKGSLYSSTTGTTNGFVKVTGLSVPGGVYAAGADGYQGDIYASGSTRSFAYSQDVGLSWTRADIPLGGAATSGTAIVVLAPEQPAIYDPSLLQAACSDSPKNGTGDSRTCPMDTFSPTQGYAGDPINTRTGIFSYSVNDLEIPTQSQPLTFQRSYSAASTSIDEQPLGPGWTDNHDIRLILPDDRFGQSDAVFVKGVTSSRYRFFIGSDGSYLPDSGVLANLTKDPGPPVEYTLTLPDQSTFVFDEQGQVTTWNDRQGFAWTYDYDSSNRLSTVTDSMSGRDLQLNYNVDGQLDQVEDSSGRQVEYGYDGQGRLTSVTDVLGGVWSYTYNNHDELTQVTDPRGIVQVATEYESDTVSPVDFSSATLSSYDPAQDIAPTVAIEDDGATLHLTGNTWKKIDFPYQVSSSTMLEFDFKSPVQGEIHGIGFDDDNHYSNNRFIRLYGTDVASGDFDIYATSAPGWKHYRIPIGLYFTGPMTYLTFINDQDVSSPTAESYFSNITVYDAHALSQTNGEGEQIAALTYNSAGTTTVEDALGHSATHDYDGRGTLVSNTDALGNPETKAFDPHLRPSAITDPGGNTVDLQWASDGETLSQMVDAEGEQTDFGYDTSNNMTSVVDPNGYLTTFDYSGTRLISTTDGLSQTTQYTYTDTGDAPAPEELLKTVTDPLGNTTTFTYDPLGNLVSMTDALLQTTIYTYDELGRQVTMTDPLGRASWTCYDAASRIVRTVVNASGDGTTPVTDPCDSANYVPASETDRDRVTSFVFDEVGNLLATIDPAGTIKRTYYDDANRPVAVVNNLVGQPISASSPPAYDSAHPDRNIRTDYAFDAAGNQIAVADTLGQVTRTYFDDLNRPETVVVNLLGQAISIGTPPSYSPSFPDENVRTQFVYDEAGNTIATIDTLGRITRIYYDRDNRPVTVVDNLVGQSVTMTTPPAFSSTSPDENLRMDYVYDDAGNRIAVIDTLGRTTRTYYDALNRPMTVVGNLYGQTVSNPTPPTYDPSHPDRNLPTDYAYDAVGNRIAVVDTLGHVTRTYYDTLRRPVAFVQNLTGQSIADPTPPAFNPASPDENVLTETTYDIAGNQIAVTDTLGRTTRRYFDPLDRDTFVVQNLTGQPIAAVTPPTFDPAFPDQNVRTQTVYDSAGDPIARLDTLGRIDRTYFDALHRPETLVQNLTGQSIDTTSPPAFDPGHPDQNVRSEFTHDGLGHVVRMVDPDGTATASCLDGLYRSVRVVDNPSVASACGSYTPSTADDEDATTHYTFDGVGNLKSQTDPNGHTQTFAYDGVDRMIGQTDPLGHITSFAYDGLGNQAWMQDAEGVTTRYDYDQVNRLRAVTEGYVNAMVSDSDTNVRTEHSYDGLGNLLRMRDAELHDTTYTYDALNRLTSEADALGHTTVYSYDGIGNQVALADANGFTTAYGYDSLDRFDLGRLPLARSRHSLCL